MARSIVEIMQELENDKEFLALKATKDEEFNRLEQMFAQDEVDMVEELNNAGFDVCSVWDFVNLDNNYYKAKDILFNHLEIKHHPRILEGIARALAVPEFGDDDRLWATLIKMYVNTLPDSEIEISEERGLQQGIATALSVLTTPSRLEALKNLLKENPNRDGTEFFEERIAELSS
ncbi:hypothetical protein [Roseibium album]|uniref:hypothetical protein n=1 Tax=Roseibium album TaxID=311410 RepID=UPI003298C7EF